MANRYVCVYVCIYMYVCMYVCMYVGICIPEVTNGSKITHKLGPNPNPRSLKGAHGTA